MTKDAEEAAATSIRGGGAYRVLIALVVGLLAGAGAQSLGDGLREPALQVAGSGWLMSRLASQKSQAGSRAR